MSNPNLNSNNEKTKIIKNRPKVYKLKHELDDYYFLCMAHKEILTIFYDYYSECDPEFVKKEKEYNKQYHARLREAGIKARLEKKMESEQK